jgi:hypothetical protein
MKALINPNEIREQGYRVAEINETEFAVADPLFWVDCSNDLIADSKWFDPIDNTFKDFPKQSSIIENQPITNGTQII